MGIKYVYRNTLIFSGNKISVRGLVTFFSYMIVLSSIVVVFAEICIFHGYRIWYSVPYDRLLVHSI